MKQTLINIAVPGTPRRLFTYSLDSQLYSGLKAGQRLVVPLGRRKVIGYYIEAAEH
ncbi:MAG: hypothetical protein JSU69_05655 [Candidatus Zixiibacteriota bacterium]|nr:MAG: hypothetical protein JSU69_05655 [candidate division Zixibacteria bacterium]